MLDIEFVGVPDMDELARHAAETKDVHVRILWAVDAEHVDCVDRQAILGLFGSAAEVKLEGRVNPILRSRAVKASRSSRRSPNSCKHGRFEAGP